ncbi:hypothetical protein JCM21900_006688 [Sporobolomyces salmonicolor]
MSTLLRVYTRSFERSPYLTLLIANGALMSLGDFSAQMLALSGTGGLAMGYDTARTLRFAVFGASMGPLAGAWNKFLEVNFPLRPTLRSSAPDMTKIKLENPIPGLEKELPKGARLERGGATAEGPHGQTKDAEVSVAALVKRVAADQLGMAPVSLVIFLVSMSMLEGLDGEEMREKIRQNYLPILLVNWQVWPILQLINFRYVPLKYRVPFGSICGIAWTAFLSFRTAKPSSD